MTYAIDLPPHTPVVIIGAGYAGLSAALRLHDCGVEAHVLEASNRVGGRVLSEQRSSIMIDHGGQWVGPDQTRLLSWIKRFECATFPTRDSGEHLELWHDGILRRYTQEGPEDGPGMRQYIRATNELDRLASRVSLDDPRSTPEIEYWDSQTVESFLRETVPCSAARRRLTLAVQGVCSCEPRDLSLFHFLFYIASAGGFAALMETEGGAQETRFVHGAQTPLLAATHQLSHLIHLNSPVRGVEQLKNKAIVHTENGTVQTQRVIVATPPPATAAMTFLPQLPFSRRRWIQRSPMGDVAKIHAVYKRAFWREKGLSGQAVLYGSDHVGVVFDNSPHNLEAGVLAAFIYGDRFRKWAAGESTDRRKSVLLSLSRLFGSEAEAIIDYTEKSWPIDCWAGGGYSAVPTPGTWFEHGQFGWRTQFDRIHWAGSETATIWHGYIDGAISSGERAASEILVKLGK